MRYQKKYYDQDGFFWNWIEINKRKHVHKYLRYEDFENNFIKNMIEESFYFKDKIIDFSNTGKVFLYSYFNKERTFFESNAYNSPNKLLKYAKFDGKTLKEIWDELK